MDRFIYDQKTGTYLLFPDKAVLRIASKSVEDSMMYVSIGISLLAWGDDSRAPKPNREIVLVGETFEVIRPVDQKIHKFKFVKKEALTGSITLVCNASEWEEIKRRITDESDYLKISYKGVSEDYWAPRKLASINIKDDDIKDLRASRKLYEQLLLVRRWMQERSPMTNADIDEWLQSSVDNQLPVQLNNGSFLLLAPSSALTLEFSKLMQSSSSIYSSQSDIKIKWEA